MKANEGGKSYDVVFHCSLRSGAMLPEAIVAEFNRSFPLVRSLPCDVPLGDHAAQYDMQEKFAKLKSGPNPFIDHAGCDLETEIEDSMFHAILLEQEQNTHQ
jgi:metallo-beta-lactamase class B